MAGSFAPPWENTTALSCDLKALGCLCVLRFNGEGWKWAHK